MLVALILASVALAAAAQLTLKYGVNQIRDRSGLLHSGAESIREVAGTPAIWVGLLLFGAYEEITSLRWAGVMLIMAGIVLVSRTPHA